MEERGCRCQTFLSILSSRKKKPAICLSFSIQIKKEVSLNMLCGHDTWSHLKLTTLKPWVNQYISFSYGNVVLRYVNEPQTLPNGLNYLLRYCSPNLCKWNYLLVFCPFQSFYGQGWTIWCHSKFYDIPFFSLTDCEWLYNIQLKTKRGLLLPPSDAYVRSFLYLLYTLIKLYYTKSLSNPASSLAPDWISLLRRPRIPCLIVQQDPFTNLRQHK